ncbi:MAG: Rne/Rng family ribonuclease [Clostridia bacterium]
MSKEIVVDISPYQTRVVLLENNLPSEIYIERRGHERLVGNIYIGKVQNVLPGMQAAFVDIGLERNAFLYAGDILVDKSDFVFDGTEQNVRIDPPNIQDMVKSGQQIMVQVLKEPVGTKGARITTHITLPGRTLVLMPTVNYVGVSRRIGNEAERARLKCIIEELKPSNIGVIVRTAAAEKMRGEFASDMEFLMRLWDRIVHKSKLLTAPRLIHAEEPLMFRTIRDMLTENIDRLIVNDKEFFERMQIVAGIISPLLRDRVELHDGMPDLFETLGLDSAIDKALSRKVWMKNGGYIVIDQTEALTTIDVNTGKYVGNDNLRETITQTNCEAAKEIARQLRLRDISGIIIIDFIDMDEISDKERVLDTLREELKNDRTKSNVLGITQLGLVEMTRKKTRQSISNTLQSTCPCCGGDGRVLSAESVVLKVRKKLLRDFNTNTTINYIVKVHPSVMEFVNKHSDDTQPLPNSYGKTIYIQAVPTFHVAEYSVEPITSADALKKAKENSRIYI